MMIKKIAYSDLPFDFSNLLLHWAQAFDTFAYLDSNQQTQTYSRFEKALAVGVVSELKTSVEGAFKKLEHFQKDTRDYLFGYLSYDLKNDIEDLTSTHFDGLQFPELYFFQPQKLFLFHADFLEVRYHESCESPWEQDVVAIENTKVAQALTLSNGTVQQRISKEQYFQKLEQLQKYLKRGDTYETNFCLEFFATSIQINPFEVFKELNALTRKPFAVFFKHEQHYLLSASPERFVMKSGDKVLTQPIKGTSRRDEDPVLDAQLKSQLAFNPKERSENIMIVDLVRNDLSKIASKGSVQVEELCKVYSFPGVHQMISTVSAVVKPDISAVEILRSMFPMGSMTGAPKISTMKIIESLEETKRGLYSGAFGYFTPDSDFDFNVIIRSILYHSENQYLSFSVGGAITAKSHPEQEYKECLLKSEAIRLTLNKFLIHS